MNDCEHGYIVRAVQDDSRFLCKECDERFVRHPDVIRRQEELAAAIIQEEKEEKQRAIEAGWEPKTHTENAKALADLIFPDVKKIQERPSKPQLMVPNTRG